MVSSPILLSLTIKPENPEPEVKFQAHYVPATWDKATAKTFNLSPYLRPRHIMRAPNLEQAIRGCDLYAKSSVVKGPMFHGFVILVFLGSLNLTVENGFG